MSRTTLTVGDLLLPGEPLDPAEVLAGEARLSNAVTWVVSLRPYPPAFPKLRGGELALVATEHIARLDPPTTLANVIAQLASRDAAGVAVRGDVGQPARDAATTAGLPLLQLADDAQLPDIEQAIMRECALYQARREMAPTAGPLSWVESALEGTLAVDREAQEEAGKHGYNLQLLISVAVISHTPEIEFSLVEQLGKAGRPRGATSGTRPFAVRYGSNIVTILPRGCEHDMEETARRMGTPCGISDTRPLEEAPTALAEAELALRASMRLYDGTPVRFNRLGADRLLLLLLRDRRSDLEAFVEITLGPLLRHDARSASPLLPTVSAFVEHGGRLRETAAEIYVHRNTLAYRLDRAAGILETDLKDAQARLAIELALRALPLLDL